MSTKKKRTILAVTLITLCGAAAGVFLRTGAIGAGATPAESPADPAAAGEPAAPAAPIALEDCGFFRVGSALGAERAGFTQ